MRIAVLKPQVVIVSPALSDANNGNWQTAKRWGMLLSNSHEVSIVKHWVHAQTKGTPSNTAATHIAADRVGDRTKHTANAEQQPVAMLALHAKRSADSIQAWADAHGCSHSCPGLVVVLTGTDLYRDIHQDAQAYESLKLAHTLVVLQDQAIYSVPEEFRHKVQVVYQSTDGLPAALNKPLPLRCVMVGHLREEKMPETLMETSVHLKDETGIEFLHIGEALDERYREQARQTMASNPRYQWLGGLPHEACLSHIRDAHLLIHCSKMEGGAHVIMEAVRSGTVVLASKIDGNVGMLGEDYSGYFTLGDSQQLATLIVSLQHELETEPGAPVDSLYRRLKKQGKARAPLFTADSEQAALLNAIQHASPSSH